MRTIVIGDIHGAYKALLQIVEKIAPTADDRLIFLGDYVDGWSESAQVVSLLLQLRQQVPCLFLKGNHDTWWGEWLLTGKTDETWLLHGGYATIESYKLLTREDKNAHHTFYSDLQDYHIDAHNRLFIHAGFTSRRGPAYERHAENYLWDRTLWEVAVTLNPVLKKTSVLYPKRLLLFDEVYLGHTPTLRYHVTTPMHAANVWNVDTGAAFTGCLSALEVGTGRYWQSDIVQDLYPLEKGRNR